MSIRKEIDELLQAGLITEETAEKLQRYYQAKKQTSSNRLFTAFGILGAVLVGLGLILIIAHHWDELSRTTKTLLSFFPLLIGQLLCAYTLLKKRNNAVWRESTTVFLFLAIGANMALISQIYHLPEDTAAFLLSWMLLGLPLVYIMNSSMASLLFLGGITYYAMLQGHSSYAKPSPYLYWLLLLSIIPHYRKLCKNRPQSNFTFFHHWAIPLSLTFALSSIAGEQDKLLFIAYFSLFGVFYILGDSFLPPSTKPAANGYKLIGSPGTVMLLLLLSFQWFWKGLENSPPQFFPGSPELLAAIVLSLTAALLLYHQQKDKKLRELKPLTTAFIFFIAVFILGTSFSSLAVLLINLYLLVIGSLTIRNGARQNQLSTLNYGLLIIAALIICRFFDTKWSFVTKGILFVLVGMSFFFANYLMIKKRSAT